MSKLIRNNILSLLAFSIVTYLSFARADNFNKVHIEIPYADKFVHFGMYFFLTFIIIIEHRHIIRTNFSLFTAALIPSAYGILVEILQSFTLTRNGDAFDGIADLIGVAVAVAAWLLVRSRLPVR